MIDITESIEKNPNLWSLFSSHLYIILEDKKALKQIEENVYNTDTTIIVFLTSIHYFKKFVDGYKLKCSKKNIMEICKTLKFEIARLDYLEKVENMKSIFKDTYLTFVTLITIVSKVYYDILPSNLIFASLWKVPGDKLNITERYILEIFNYHVYINKEIVEGVFNLVFVENKIKTLYVKKQERRRRGILNSIFYILGDGFPCCGLSDK